MASKYQPLADHLAAQPPGVAELTLTPAEIEAVLGAPLPKAARQSPFWSNGRGGGGAARPWLALGWRARPRARMGRVRTVTFARAGHALGVDAG